MSKLTERLIYNDFAYTALLHFTSLEICIPAKMAGHARNVDRFANEIRQPIDDEREV